MTQIGLMAVIAGTGLASLILAATLTTANSAEVAVPPRPLNPLQAEPVR